MRKISQISVQKTDRSNNDKELLDQFFQTLGLKPDEQQVFTTLTPKGTLTALELSRATHLPRTRIYRILEELKTRGFIQEIIDEHRSLFRAIDLPALNQQIKLRQSQVEQLTVLFPQVAQSLTAQTDSDSAETQVRFYRGREGLRQLVWHTLRAEKECIGYTYRRLEEYLGEDFMRDWRDNFMEKGLIFRDIYSDEYLLSKTKKAVGVNYPPQQWISRYVPKQTLNINLQMDVYNDVVAQYNWHEGDVFGVEIYNHKIAAFHKQMFEIVWHLSNPEKKMELASQGLALRS